MHQGPEVCILQGPEVTHQCPSTALCRQHCLELSKKRLLSSCETRGRNSPYVQGRSTYIYICWPERRMRNLACAVKPCTVEKSLLPGVKDRGCEQHAVFRPCGRYLVNFARAVATFTFLRRRSCRATCTLSTSYRYRPRVSSSPLSCPV